MSKLPKALLKKLPLEQIAIPLLMKRSKIPWKIKKGNDWIDFRLHEEQCLSIEFADELRKYTTSGDYKGIWFHVPNEGKRSVLTGIICCAMGMLAGVSDFIFMGPWGHGVIEFKSPTGSLSEYQKYFQYWCQLNHIPFAVHTTVAGALQQLREWAALVDK